MGEIGQSVQTRQAPGEGVAALMRWAVDVASSAFVLEAPTAARWLERVVERVASVDGRSGVVEAMIVRPADGVWQTVDAAVGGLLTEPMASALADDAAAGWANDDVGYEAGHRQVLQRVVSGTRRDLVGDRAWSVSSYGTRRRHLGLGEFARVLIPFEEVGVHHTLVLQWSATSTGHPPESMFVLALENVARAVAQAYRERFITPREHQATLLARLTTTQRRIAPLLIEGKSESAVARELGRSAHTIHDHTKTIYHAWGVKSRMQMRDVWFGRAVAGRPHG